MSTVANPYAGYDRRQTFWLTAEAWVMAAQELRTGVANPPAEYWPLIAEAQVFAALALAPDGVMLPIVAGEDRGRREREQLLARQRAEFEAALAGARKADDEWPIGEVQG